MSDDYPPPVDSVHELFEQIHACEACQRDGICPYHDGALYMLEVD